MSKTDTLLVMAESYDNVQDAEADYEKVKALYKDAKTSDDFDAAVLARGDDGKVTVVKKHEQPTRHGRAARPEYERVSGWTDAAKQRSRCGGSQEICGYGILDRIAQCEEIAARFLQTVS